MSDTTYNGWTNYESWLCGLWLDNDQATHEHWRERAAELLEEEGDRDQATHQLASEIEEECDELRPECVGLFHDLLTAAIQEIDWREVAEHFLPEEEE